MKIGPNENKEDKGGGSRRRGEKEEEEGAGEGEKEEDNLTIHSEKKLSKSVIALLVVTVSSRLLRHPSSMVGDRLVQDHSVPQEAHNVTVRQATSNLDD